MKSKLNISVLHVEDLKLKEEKLQRLQNELRHLLESLAIQLSSPVRFVETQEGSIRERLREVLQENKDRLMVCGKLLHDNVESSRYGFGAF